MFKLCCKADGRGKREKKKEREREREGGGRVCLKTHCWNQLPAEVLGTLPCKLKTLKKRVRKAIIEVI